MFLLKYGCRIVYFIIRYVIVYIILIYIYIKKIKVNIKRWNILVFFFFDGWKKRSNWKFVVIIWDIIWMYNFFFLIEMFFEFLVFFVLLGLGMIFLCLMLFEVIFSSFG